MVENLYFLVTNTSTWTSGDPRQLLDHYFIENGAFTTSLLIALGVAVVGLLIFYGWIGMSSNRLSNLPTWLVTLCSVGLITLGMTQMTVVGSQDSQTGFFEDAQQYVPVLKEGVPDADMNAFNNDVENIREAMDKGCDVVYTLDLWNMAIALVIFFVGSIAVKRMTRYAIAIPF